MNNKPDKIGHDDVEAMLGVRQEMGAEITPALVDSMAEQIEIVVQQRTADVRRELELQRPQTLAPGARLAVAIVSLVMAIPLTAISASIIGLIGVIVVWAGIAGVNLALGFNGRPPGSSGSR